MSEKLTVLIPCKNERMNIRPCLESVRAVADEILVADSGSTDGTLDIVREMGGCRVVEREYIDSGNFKNWAIPQAAHPWVLIVDADERVTPELAAEIKQTLASPACDGYRILRATISSAMRSSIAAGTPMTCCGCFAATWAATGLRRPCRRRSAERPGRQAEGAIPALHLLVDGAIFPQARPLYDAERQQRLARGRRASYLDLLLRAPVRFFHSYVIRLGFLDGVPGLVLCMLTSFYSFTKAAKLWALEAGLPQPDPVAGRSASIVPWSSHCRPTLCRIKQPRIA